MLVRGILIPGHGNGLVLITGIYSPLNIYHLAVDVFSIGLVRAYHSIILTIVILAIGMDAFMRELAITIIAIYFGSQKRRGIYRVVQRLILAIPAWHYLMHKATIPSLFTMKDHILVEMRY